MATIDEIMMGTVKETAPKVVSSPTGIDEIMLGTPTTTPKVETLVPKQEESQLARKSRGFAGGLANSIADSAVGLFRMSATSKDREIATTQKAIQKIKGTDPSSERFRHLLKSQLAFEKESRRKTVEKADIIDSFWNEKLAPLEVENPTFWDQVAVGTGQLPLAAAAAVPAVGIPILFARMTEEGYASFIANGDSPEEARAKAENYALKAAPLEFLQDRFIISKGGIKGLQGLGGKEAIAEGAKNLAKVAKKMGISGVGGGLVEVIQDGLINRLNGKPMFDENSLNTFAVAGTVEMLGGGGVTLSTAKQQANVSNSMRKEGMSEAAIKEVVDDLEIGDIDSANTRLMQEGIALNPEVLSAQMEEDDITYEVAEYKVGAARLGEAALQKSTTLLESELAKTSEDDLANMAGELGYVGVGTKEDMTNFLLENRSKLPSFQRKAQKALLDNIKNREDLDNMDKQIFKWLATGDISLGEISQNIAVFENTAKEAGYPDVRSFFNANQGDFTAPTKEQLELYQRGLPVEDNPSAIRNKKFATAKFNARSMPIGVSRHFAMRLLDKMENPENMSRDIASIVARRDKLENKWEVLSVLNSMEPSTLAEEQYLKYAKDIINGKPQDRELEESIREGFTADHWNRIQAMDKYNPFPFGEPAYRLYGSVLERRAMRRLSFSPLTPWGGSKWQEAGMRSDGTFQEEGGTIGGKGADSKRVLEVATHEQTHGVFEMIEPWIREKTEGNKKWKNSAFDLAALYYRSPGDTYEAIANELKKSDSRSENELLAMYIAGEYNTIDPTLLKSADGVIEELFRQGLGDDFVEAMKMSRDAAQARTVPEEPGQSRFTEFYQSDAGGSVLSNLKLSSGLQEEVDYRLDNSDDLTLEELIQEMMQDDADRERPAYQFRKELQSIGIQLGIYKGHTKGEIDDIQVTSGKKYDFKRGDSYYRFDSWSPLQLNQKGKTLPSGSQVIRGRTVFLPDGKFVTDLMKGGDVLTLAHEFAHIFSPHMSEKMIDAMIDRVVKEGGEISLNKNPTQRKSLQRYIRGVWDTFKRDPYHERFLNKNGADFKYLVSMQEMLATQFETYLATSTAPTSELAPTFKLFAERYRGYYGKIRSLPIEQQKVANKIAVLFDDMIAGEKALPRVQPRKITVDGVVYKLHLSRPKELARRKVLKALERVDADLVGVKDKIQDYFKEAFTETYTNKKGEKVERLKVPEGLPLALELVKNNKEALSLMKKVDGILAKRELTEKKSLIKEMKEWASDHNLKHVDTEIAAMIRGVIDNLDTHTKTGARVREFVEFKKALDALRSGAMSEMDFSFSKDKIDKILELDKPSIYNKSFEEIQEMHNAMKDLVRYDKVRIEQHVAKEIKHLEGLVTEFKDMNKGTRQWKQSHKRRTALQQKIEKALYSSGLSGIKEKYMTGVHWNPSRELEELHEAAYAVYKKLAKGDEKKQKLEVMFDEAMSAIVAGVDLKGVSTARGPVSSSDKVILDLRTERNIPYKYEMTKAQIMYFYGISRNEEGMRILVENGFRIPTHMTSRQGEEARTLKFTSPESMKTTFALLTPEQRGIVDNIINYNREVARPLGNENSQDLLGIDVLQQDVYLPFAREGRSRGDIRVLHQMMGSDNRKESIQEFLSGKGSFEQQYVEHSGFLHARSGGESPMYAMDFFEIMERYYSDLATYVGMARPLRDATAVLQTGGKGSVHEELIDMLGKVKADALADYVKYVEDPTLKSSSFDTIFTKLSSSVRRGILKFKAVIGLSQVVSLNNYKNYLPEGPGLHIDFTRVLATGRMGIPLTSKYSKKALAARNVVLKTRFQNVPEVGLTDKGEKARVKRMFGSEKGVKDVVKVLTLSGDIGLGWIRNPDAFAISKGLELFELQAKRYGWTEEEMMERFIHATNRTQPSNNPIHTSRFIGKPSKGIKRFTFGIFQSATDNIRGEKQTHTTRILDAKFRGDKEGEKLAKKRLFRAVVTNAALLSLVRMIALRVLFRGGDDEDEDNIISEYVLTTLSRIIGIDPLLGAAVNQVLAKLSGMYQGSFNAPMLQQMEYLTLSLGELASDIAQGESEDVPEDVYEVLKNSAALFGSGWSSILSQAEKAIGSE